MKNELRVLVCGGRDYVARGPLWDVLDGLNPAVIVQGGCRGADESAHAWAKENGRISETYWPDWDARGERAATVRNQHMVDSKPDIVVACPGGAGTGHCVSRAEAAKIDVVRVIP